MYYIGGGGTTALSYVERCELFLNRRDRYHTPHSTPITIDSCHLSRPHGNFRALKPQYVSVQVPVWIQEFTACE